MVKTHQPKTIEEAVAIRAAEGAIPYAGGTDLMVEAQSEKPYVFLNKIPELKGITDTGDAVVIGAATTFSEIEDDPAAPELLRTACAQIAAPGIRNAGTIGGNIANASPKADSVLTLYVMDADVVLAGSAGGRRMPISEFILGRGKTALGPDEILTQIIIKKENIPENFYYQKVGARAALAISRVSFAAYMTLADGLIQTLSTGFGAIENTVFTRPDINAMLVGKTPEEAKALRDDFMNAYAAAIDPISGRVSAEYRKDVCLNLLDDFLTQNGV